MMPVLNRMLRYDLVGGHHARSALFGTVGLPAQS